MFVRIEITDVKKHRQGKNYTAAPNHSDNFDYTPFKKTCPKIFWKWKNNFVFTILIPVKTFEISKMLLR